MVLATNYLSIGKDKNGEIDFAISSEVQFLTQGEINELRIMIMVAIGTMESCWRKNNEPVPNTNSTTGA